jgi:hypothetical protein
MPCSTADDRVRWVSGALQENSQFDSVLVIGTVKSVVFDEGQPWVSVMFNDLWSLSRGKFARESRSLLAYACPQWPTSRNFNTTANVVARFAAGTKLMMFATPRLDSQTGNILYVSPCNGEITSACLVAGNPQCASGLVRQQLLAAASANADLARALDVDAAITCAKPCMNAGQCKLGVCACLANFTGETCEKARLPPPAVTVTATRIVPGAGSNNSDVWVSGTTRKIQIPIQSVDRTTPTGFARVMLLNRSPASWCSQQLPNASLDGLPAWYFADMGPQFDLTTNPRYIATELLAVVDLSKLKWVTGSKARSTIVVEHTLTLAESCKDAGSDYPHRRDAELQSRDDAALAGPFTGGQFAIAEGGCIGDGVVGICRSRVGAADVCFAASPLRAADTGGENRDVGSVHWRRHRVLHSGPHQRGRAADLALHVLRAQHAQVATDDRRPALNVVVRVGRNGETDMDDEPRASAAESVRARGLSRRLLRHGPRSRHREQLVRAAAGARQSRQRCYQRVQPNHVVRQSATVVGQVRRRAPAAAEFAKPVLVAVFRQVLRHLQVHECAVWRG